MSLLKISLLFALVGTALLLFLSIQIEPKLIDIKDINMEEYDSFVKIQGNIFSIRQPGNITIMMLRDNTDEIEVITYEKINITKGSFVEVIGKVGEYEHNLQVEASKIKNL